MNTRPLAVIAQKESKADHRFPELLHRTLGRMGWQVQWLPANVDRFEFSRILTRLKRLSTEPVFWSVNYNAQLAQWCSFEGLTCIAWNEVFPLGYRDFRGRSPHKNFWIFDSSDIMIEKYRELEFRTEFQPFGFDPDVFVPESVPSAYNVSFVGSGLRHMEAYFANSLSEVCNEIDGSKPSTLSLQALQSVAEFYQLFIQMPWENLERYKGDTLALMDAFIAGLSVDDPTKSEIRERLYEENQRFSGQYGRFQRAVSVRTASEFGEFALFGRGWEELELEAFLHGPVAYQDTADIFRRSKINLHLHRLYMDGVNDRMINVPACGGLLLSRNTPQLQRIMEEGEHYVGFDTVAEMKDKIAWLLKDEQARQRIAKAGCAHVRSRYSMEDQVRGILKTVGLPDPSSAAKAPGKSRPSASKGSSARFTSSTPLRMAVIGHGSMGRHHARVVDQLDGVELVAIADQDQSGLAPVAKRYGCSTYTSAEELLESESIDAVSIAVPTSLHETVTREALLRGIHVLVEKPIASSVQEALTIENLASTSQAKLMVGHIERFNPAIRELKARIDRGELGELFHLEAYRQGPYPSRIMDVGVAVDLAVHDIDIIRYLSGQEVEQVYGQARNRIQGPHEDSVHGILKMTGDVVAKLSVNWVTPTKVRRLSVLGEAGMFVVDYIAQDLFFFQNACSKEHSWQAMSLFRGVGEGQMVRYPIPKMEPLRNEIEHFVDCVRNNKDPVTSANDGVRALTIAQALLESSRIDKSLDLQRTTTGSHLRVAV